MPALTLRGPVLSTRKTPLNTTPPGPEAVVKEAVRLWGVCVGL